MREGIPRRDPSEARVTAQPKATPGVFFVDTETTGLDPNLHDAWEVALIEPNGTEHVWQLGVMLSEYTSVKALEIGRFRERYDKHHLTSHEQFIDQFIDLTWGLHWAGAVPSFDEKFIRKVFRGDPFGATIGMGGTLPPNWHYHLIDVEALAVGYLLGESQYELVLPWDSTHLSDAMGVDRHDPLFEKHTAIGDARWARAIYIAAMERKEPGDRRQAAS